MAMGAVMTTCQKHGVFISVAESIAGIEHWTPCPDCDKEQEQRSREYEEKRRREHEQRFQSAILARMKIPVRFHAAETNTFEAYTDRQKQICAMVQQYVEEFEDNVRLGRGLIFIGRTGCGKTHLACAIANALGRRSYKVRYVTAAALIDDIRETWRKDSSRTQSDVMHDLQKLDLLIVDDVGLHFDSDSAVIQLTQVIDVRYQNQKPTIVISNCNMTGLGSLLGDRAIDRLRDGGKVLTFDWDSWRHCL